MATQYDHYLSELKKEYDASKDYYLRIDYKDLYEKYENSPAKFPPTPIKYT